MSASDFYNQSINDIGGKSISMDAYKGKVVVVTNIATQCGYTPQLKGLESLYQKYRDKGLVVLGIPSNDFGGQTPQAESEVKKFCKLNYGVTFPLTSKTPVKGEKKHPLVAELLKQSDNKSEIGWNFEKFLIGPDGKVIDRFSSSVKPMDTKITGKIDGLLTKNNP